MGVNVQESHPARRRRLTKLHAFDDIPAGDKVPHQTADSAGSGTTPKGVTMDPVWPLENSDFDFKGERGPCLLPEPRD